MKRQMVQLIPEVTKIGEEQQEVDFVESKAMAHEMLRLLMKHRLDGDGPSPTGVHDPMHNISLLIEMLMNHSTVRTDPPQATLSDHVEIGFYVLLILIGLPLNVMTLIRVARRYAATKARIFLLQIHLNISDLLILIFHAFYRACWLMTYQWYGGDYVCCMMKFLDNLGVAFSSNVIVCISFDRLYSLRTSPTVGARIKRVKLSLLIAWLAALFISVPHFFIWKVTEGFKNWHQCVSIFKLWKIPYVPDLSVDEKMKINSYNSYLRRMELTWSMINIMANFWIPAFLICVCYAIILRQVYDKLGNDGKDVQVIKFPNETGRTVEYFGKRDHQMAVGAGATSDCSTTSSSQHKAQQIQYHNKTAATYVPQAYSFSYTATNRLGGGSGGAGGVNKKGSYPYQNFHSCSEQLGGATRTTTATTTGSGGVLSEEASARMLRIRRRKYRTLLLTFALVSAYVLCWLPYNILMLWQISSEDTYKRFEDNLYFLYGLIVLNSAFNPLIYGHIRLCTRSSRGGGGGNRRNNRKRFAGSEGNGRAFTLCGFTIVRNRHK